MAAQLLTNGKPAIDHENTRPYDDVALRLTIRTRINPSGPASLRSSRRPRGRRGIRPSHLSRPAR